MLYCTNHGKTIILCISGSQTFFNRYIIISYFKSRHTLDTYCLFSKNSTLGSKNTYVDTQYRFIGLLNIIYYAVVERCIVYPCA